MNSKECFQLLGITADFNDPNFEEIVNSAYYARRREEALKYATEPDYDAEYDRNMELLNEARSTLFDIAARKRGRDIDPQTGARKVRKTRSAAKEKNRSGKGLKVAVACVVVAGAISVVSFIGHHLGWGNDKNDGLNNKVGIEMTAPGYSSPDSSTETPSTESTQTPDSSTNESTEEPDQSIVETKYYGDVQDEALVKERAEALASELSAAGIVNPTSGGAYTAEQIATLVQYANGVYTPSSMEEIDVLHMDLLNILISPLNTDAYLYHVVYASGNDDFKDIAIEEAKNVKPIDFASAFAEYGENGVYPLTLWMQQKREEIYSTTDREQINKIYVEVGQVMADIMKGNGCTITLYEDKQEYTYTFTSEQILANHASAMLLTIDAQLIFANHYEIRDENNKVVDAVQTQWEVYNKFHSTEEPDIVTLAEIEAWINNGCDYEWEIDDVLINGQTFGQRIQGDMEGMAQNNYAMSSDNKTLTK